MAQQGIDERIAEYLAQNQDTGYRDFQLKLIPTVAPATMVGVRTPALRKLARELARRPDVGEFLAQLPHGLFDENQLHAFIIGGERDYDVAVGRLQAFLPHVDNWATCDQMSCKVLASRPRQTLGHVGEWIASSHVYTVRYGVGVLLEHFLGDAFDPAQLQMVAGIDSDEYYVNMMRAWYFAEALAKQEPAALPFIEREGALDAWTRSKAIQKARESRRISPELKDHLLRLKRKG